MSSRSSSDTFLDDLLQDPKLQEKYNKLKHLERCVDRGKLTDPGSFDGVTQLSRASAYRYLKNKKNFVNGKFSAEQAFINANQSVKHRGRKSLVETHPELQRILPILVYKYEMNISEISHCLKMIYKEGCKIDEFLQMRCKVLYKRILQKQYENLVAQVGLHTSEEASNNEISIKFTKAAEKLKSLQNQSLDLGHGILNSNLGTSIDSISRQQDASLHAPKFFDEVLSSKSKIPHSAKSSQAPTIEPVHEETNLGKTAPNSSTPSLGIQLTSNSTTNLELGKSSVSEETVGSSSEDQSQVAKDAISILNVTVQDDPALNPPDVSATTYDFDKPESKATPSKPSSPKLGRPRSYTSNQVIVRKFFQELKLEHLKTKFTAQFPNVKISLAQFIKTLELDPETYSRPSEGSSTINQLRAGDQLTSVYFFNTSDPSQIPTLEAILNENKTIIKLLNQVGRYYSKQTLYNIASDQLNLKYFAKNQALGFHRSPKFPSKKESARKTRKSTKKEA